VPTVGLIVGPPLPNSHVPAEKAQNEFEDLLDDSRRVVDGVKIPVCAGGGPDIDGIVINPDKNVVALLALLGEIELRGASGNIPMID